VTLEELLQPIVSYLPAFLTLLLILFLGYIVGHVVENSVNRAADAIGIKRRLRFGLERELKKYGFSADITELFGKFLKYLIYLITIAIALNYLGISMAKESLVLLLSYSPNILAAFLILVIGAIITEFAFDIIRFKLQEYGLDQISYESGVKVRISALVALFLKYFIYVVIVTMALAQLGFQVLSIIILLSILWFICTVTVALLFIFATKDFLPDITMGLYIKSTGCFKKGDTIESGGIKGKVISIGLIVTEVSSGSKVHRIPNSLILKSSYSISKGH
jgi:small-conductance mechanosensitive channel